MNLNELQENGISELEGRDVPGTGCRCLLPKFEPVHSMMMWLARERSHSIMLTRRSLSFPFDCD